MRMIFNRNILTVPSPAFKMPISPSMCIWYHPILKLSSPCIRWSLIDIFVWWLNKRAICKPCGYRTGWHIFHCSEYFQCWLYNPDALLYTFSTAMSTPTSYLWALVFVGSELHVTSGAWGSIVSLFAVLSGCGAPCILSMRRLLID
jgi:hypothetical protein